MDLWHLLVQDHDNILIGLVPILKIQPLQILSLCEFSSEAADFLLFPCQTFLRNANPQHTRLETILINLKGYLQKSCGQEEGCFFAHKIYS